MAVEVNGEVNIEERRDDYHPVDYMPVLGWGQLARCPLCPAVAHAARYCVTVPLCEQGRAVPLPSQREADGTRCVPDTILLRHAYRRTPAP